MINLKKNKNGFTLVELIVAMFIITLVVTSIIPMLVMGYKQIISSGKKNTSVYTTQKKAEDILAGNANTYTNVHEKYNYISSIDLTFDGVSGVHYIVNGNKLEIEYTGSPSYNVKTFKPN